MAICFLTILVVVSQNAQLEYGVLCGHSLEMLDQVMTEVFVPRLTAPFLKESKDASLIAGNYVADTAHNEFIGNMQKFISQLSHAIQQVSSCHMRDVLIFMLG